MASSSSVATDSLYCPRWTYDVFLSFRGADTRNKFTSHLYEGLKNGGISAFQDNKRLEHGDSIPEGLLKAIEGSQVALIIFSKNYARSSWCLNELVKIMECKEKNGQIVIPVFFDVDPSEVRKQTESFGEAFAEQESKYKKDVEGMQKVQAWRTALTTAANLKGYDIRDKDEAEKISQIVAHISSEYCKSDRSLSCWKDVVGIKAHLEELISRLQIEINDVRVLGICGMSGIGKTTIAKALFNTLSDKFKSVCFLADVKENAKKNELHSLQNTLLSELLRRKDHYVSDKYDGKSMIPRRLCSMKVLIVLDDIDHNDHLEYLAGDVSWFGNGSRIIVTTKNRPLIEKDNVYEVYTLPDQEALQLFNQHAFKKEAPDECFKELSWEVVNHADGLPLALKVWGSMLHNKDLNQWRRTVDQIKKNPNLEIVEKLRISYDGLEQEEQEIFLDIACFFCGYKRTKVIQILESCFGVEYGLDVLIDRSLVSISKDDRIEMHDLIQAMGEYLVKMQKNLGKPNRILNVEDFEDVMVDDTGAMAVEAIWLDQSTQICFSVEAMKNMRRLRIFVWRDYPWKLLPQNFNPTRLVHLELQWSSLHHLWNETKQLKYVRRLNLSYSKSLKRTPDFTGMPNLEYLNLRGCTNLEEVHHSLICSRKLTKLNLTKCESLERFPYVNVESHNFEHLPRSIAQLGALRTLYLSDCKKLQELPCFTGMPNLNILNLSRCNLIDGELPEDIGSLSSLKTLYISGNNFERLPRSIAQLGALQTLYLSYCKKLKELPCFTGMPNLDTLDLSYCNLIDGALPEDIGSLSSLKTLHLRGNNFELLPRSIAQLGALRTLYLSDCKKLKELPCFTGMPNLDTLDLSCCNLIDGALPEDIGSLSSLKTLHLRGNNFELLPRSIAQLGALQTLYLSDCKKLKEFPCFTGMPNLDTLDLSRCNLIDGELPEDIGSLSSLKTLNLSGNNFERLPRSIAQLGALRTLYLSDCKKLKELPCFTGMPNLDTLIISHCNLIDGALPEDIGSLSSLKELNLSGNNFERLPRSIARLGALRTFDLSDCKKLKELPCFTGMPNLDFLIISHCNLIDGALPEDIGSLSSLKTLYLKGNNFERLPRSIARLGALRTFDLSDCKKLKELPCFTGMPNLDTLDLSDCNLIDGALPEDIGSLSSLKRLYLRGNNFERLPRSIAQLGALRTLYLSDCKKLKELPYFTGMPNLDTLIISHCNLIDGALPGDIGSLSSLKKLNLSGNNFERLPRSIAQLGALRTLYLSYCKKLKELPYFTGMPNLDTLDLSRCNLIDGELPEDIGSLSSLKTLYISGNNFERLPRSIAQLGALQTLYLSDCKKLKELPCFTGMPNLDTLDLSLCNLIDGELPEDIGSLSSLKTLNLSGNNFERLPRSIAQLGALRTLYLSDCKKLKELPCFTGMPNLDTLDLSRCNLIDGALPEDIGSLSSLKTLHLRGNNFELLPRSIAQLGALQTLYLSDCKKLKEFPCFTGMPNLDTLDLSRCNLIDGELPEDIGSLSSLKTLNLSGNNFERLPRSIAQLGALRTLYLSDCKKLKELPCFTGMPNLDTLIISHCNLIDGALPEDIGSLSSLKTLYLKGNNFERLPRSIAQLGALRTLYLLDCKKLKELPCFTGMPNLDTLIISHCNLIDGALPEDIGSLSFLNVLNLSGNNFERLPRSIAQLSTLEFLNLSDCKKLKELPCFTGMPNLYNLDLSSCNLIDGALPEDIGSLSFLNVLNLSGNNFERLPRSIAQLGALESLYLSDCKKLKELPEFPQQLHKITADWSNDWICNWLFQNISSLQHNISASLRLYTSCSNDNIPRWFHHRLMDTSVSVNLPENWYLSDNFLGFAVCYSGELIVEITAHLIPLCDDGMSSMTQKFALSNHSKYGIHFCLVPLTGLWDASKANGKTPNDYGCFRLFPTGEMAEFGEKNACGVRLLYKDEPKLHIGIRRSRYEDGCCSSSKKLRPFFPTSPGF